MGGDATSEWTTQGELPVNASHTSLGTVRKSAMYAASLTLLAAFTAKALTVTDVSARQRWPWNNLVDVDFSLSGTEANAYYQIDVAATFPGIVGDEVGAKTLITEPIVSGDGAHRLTWDLEAQYPGLVTTNFKVRVTATPLGDAAPVYMVIDLSAGPEAGAGAYPVRYTTRPPDLTDDTCRTTEMWLRRCPAGTFTMGYDGYYSETGRSAWAPHDVTHSWPFYIGIFEVTQQQWYQVKGTWPSYFTNETYRATRPVERVSFQGDVRGDHGWTDNNPANGVNCSSGTFIKNMRTRTGITWLDVPTESQWEYAARAGTDYVYCWEGVTGSTIVNFARGANTPTGLDNVNMNVGNSQNMDTRVGTGKVGSYAPNNWGLYDMLGNVAEWCGDGYSTANITGEGYTFVDPRMNPAKPTTYSGGRVTRGGSYMDPNNYLSVYNRVPVGTADKGRDVGFRVVVTVK